MFTFRHTALTLISSSLMTQPSEAEQIKANLANIAKIGTPEGTNANYPLGWAQAANTPFKFWKQDAHSEGGTRNPLIVFYPKSIKDKGGIRTQYGHVNDLCPPHWSFWGSRHQPRSIQRSWTS